MGNVACDASRCGQPLTLPIFMRFLSALRHTPPFSQPFRSPPRHGKNHLTHEAHKHFDDGSPHFHRGMMNPVERPQKTGSRAIPAFSRDRTMTRLSWKPCCVQNVPMESPPDIEVEESVIQCDLAMAAELLLDIYIEKRRRQFEDGSTAFEQPTIDRTPGSP